jgi:hypothetical protein
MGDPLDLDAARRGERIRLGGLLALWERWRVTGPWEPLLAALLAGPAAVIEALRVPGGAISASRARIMAANVVFPFAAAQAARIGDDRFPSAPEWRIWNRQGCRRTRSLARWRYTLA